jgi:hypothetical protein
VRDRETDRCIVRANRIEDYIEEIMRERERGTKEEIEKRYEISLGTEIDE